MAVLVPFWPPTPGDVPSEVENLCWKVLPADAFGFESGRSRWPNHCMIVLCDLSPVLEIGLNRWDHRDFPKTGILLESGIVINPCEIMPPDSLRFL